MGAGNSKPKATDNKDAAKNDENATPTDQTTSANKKEDSSSNATAKVEEPQDSKVETDASEAKKEETTESKVAFEETTASEKKKEEVTESKVDSKVDETSKDTCAKEGQQLLFLVGSPGTGKTFLGDYLATRGWHHIDGDQGKFQSDKVGQERWGNFYQAMTGALSGQEVSDDLWQPYYDYLIQQYRECIKSGKDVVLTFAVYNLFGDGEYVRKAIPGIQHVIIEVSDDIRLKRCMKREREELEKAGTSEAEVWAADYMAEYRERYGQEYTEERYAQMMRDGAKEQKFVNLDKDEKLATVDNDDWENNVAIKQLNELVGLKWEDIDTDKIAAVNMARMENLSMELSTGASDVSESENAEAAAAASAAGSEEKKEEVTESKVDSKIDETR